MKQPQSAVDNTAKNALVEPPESTGPDKTATWRYDTKTVEAAPVFLAIEPLAARLGVPIAWLKREAGAGRIPSLTIGLRRLFHPESVAEVLIERSATPSTDSDLQRRHERADNPAAINLPPNRPQTTPDMPPFAVSLE